MSEEPPMPPIVPFDKNKRLQLASTEPMRMAEHLAHYEFTDDQGRITLAYRNGDFYEFKKGRSIYVRMEPDSFSARAYRLLDRTDVLKVSKEGKCSVKAVAPKLQTIRELSKAVLAAVPSCDASGVPPLWLRNPKTEASQVIPTSSGLLVLPERELIPSTPDFFATVGTSVEYDGDAPQPVEWLAFLESVWGDDPQCISALQEIFGYLVTTDTSQQKIFFIIGPTRSGKGTILKVLNTLIGLANVAAPTLSSLATRFGLAPLLDRTLATITDARLSARSDQAQITETLLSISGEDLQTVDRKGENTIECYLKTRFLIVSNELPKLNDASAALTGRLIVLPMTKSFLGRERPDLSDALLDELPGILNWALDGYDRLTARGHFQQPDSGLAEVEEVSDLASPVRAFVRDRCELNPVAQVTRKALYRSFCDWCDETGNRTVSDAVFGRNLRAAVPGLGTRRPLVNGVQARVYLGISIIEEASP